ncbi:hypothetical protein LTS18_005202 [Coniosporium uncinatum]|uniref:Uncharacterized protein n=1 Tax=Coniosporium uncinatum TaxID=93489 RepID=A0ACC3DBI2_9PEZI|nr:hypothetical protein LTS18_005202 [Coniosporium uncinatum]
MCKSTVFGCIVFAWAKIGHRVLNCAQSGKGVNALAKFYTQLCLADGDQYLVDSRVRHYSMSTARLLDFNEDQQAGSDDDDDDDDDGEGDDGENGGAK